MTRHTPIAGGPRTKQLRAAFYEARIAQAQSAMFDRAEGFIDHILENRSNPEKLAELVELVAASQYGGPTGNVAEKSRQAIARLLETPESKDLRRILLGYLVYEIQSPTFDIAFKSDNAPAPAKEDFFRERLIPPLSISPG